MRYKLIVPIILIISLISCSSEMHKTHSPKPIAQPVIFHHYFINYAWGYQNRGWFIDNKGIMMAYQISKGSDWSQVETSPPDSGYITKAALLANYQHADKAVYRIPYVEVRNNYDIIGKAADGDITARTRGAYDAGLVMNVAYLWDPSRGKFKAILLSQSGDWEMYNISPAAEEINRWLNDLNKYYADSLAVWQK
jgi:hypothetical protein